MGPGLWAVLCVLAFICLCGRQNSANEHTTHTAPTATLRLGAGSGAAGVRGQESRCLVRKLALEKEAMVKEDEEGLWERVPYMLDPGDLTVALKPA